MFLVNSRQGIFRCGPDCSGQALYRRYGRFFAEFLGEHSLVRLGLLDLITCGGLRYGRTHIVLRSFSRKALHAGLQHQLWHRCIVSEGSFVSSPRRIFRARLKHQSRQQKTQCQSWCWIPVGLEVRMTDLPIMQFFGRRRQSNKAPALISSVPPSHMRAVTEY